MPVRLILMRHAKSAWPEGVADFDRPLAPRGMEAAPLMGRWLAKQGITPDQVLVSAANARGDMGFGWRLLPRSRP